MHGTNCGEIVKFHNVTLRCDPKTFSFDNLIIEEGMSRYKRAVEPFHYRQLGVLSSLYGRLKCDKVSLQRFESLENRRYIKPCASSTIIT